MTEGDDRGLARIAAWVLGRLVERFTASQREVPGDLYWRRAVCLRAAGQLKEAVAMSDVLHQGVEKGSDDRKILATTRRSADGHA